MNSLQNIYKVSDWLMLPTPPTALGFRSFDPECFWIDTGLSGTIQERGTFFL